MDKYSSGLVPRERRTRPMAGRGCFPGQPRFRAA